MTTISANPFEMLGDGPISKPSEKKISTTTSKPKPRGAAKTATKGKTVTVDDLIQKDKDSRPRGGAQGGRGSRGSGRGRGGSSRGGRGRGGDSRGARHDGFDRRSASGRHDTDKAKNAGWGDEKEEYTGEETKPKKVDEEVKQAIPEPEDNLQTYEEYLANKAKNSLQISKDNVRTANEGTDDPKWKEAVKLERKGEEFFAIKQTTTKSTPKPKTEKKSNKVHLAFEAKFNTPPTSERSSRGRGGESRGRGEGRGSRGEGRGDHGRGGRGGDRPQRGSQGRVEKIDDPKSFPALGSN